MYSYKTPGHQLFLRNNTAFYGLLAYLSQIPDNNASTIYIAPLKKCHFALPWRIGRDPHVCPRNQAPRLHDGIILAASPNLRMWLQSLQ
jgi:hypothetical protein